jgi:hypothetical protein
VTLEAEITTFVRSGAASEEDFERLARAAFAYQFDRIPAYRALCVCGGRTPAEVATWRDVPMVPAAAFATSELATDPAVELFRSSGTLGAARSVHRHPFPALYRAVVESSFPAACLPRGDRPPMLALVPPRDVVPDSSLGFMVDHVLASFGGPGSAYAFGARGVELGNCRSWLAAHQRGGRPVLILATALALADLLDFLARTNLHFRLPGGSAIFETGGFKGRTREVSRDELLDQEARWLGVPAEAVVSEYGMTELTSQAYTRTLVGGVPGLFVAPRWMRVRALDPLTLAELPPGESGILAIFDLANLGSVLHLLTEDLGRIEGEGFRLDGRAGEADLRGCSLLAEEMSRR